MQRSLVGGNIEKNETPLKAMLREAKEEAGVVLKKEDLSLVKVVEFQKQDTLHQRFYFKLNNVYQYSFHLGEPEKFDYLEWIDFEDYRKSFKKTDLKVLQEQKLTSKI